MTIGSPRDKVIQEAIRSVISCIYEPKFSRHSHGFRPKKSRHSALKEVKGWKEASWFLEFDIRKCFDTINRKRLINILQEEIQDQALFDILHKMFQAKIINLDMGDEDQKVGTPQGSIISPLLCNVYLDKLDKHVEQLILDTNRGVGRRRNPEYLGLTAEKNMPWSTRRQRHKKALRLGLTSTIRNDETFRKLKYVRYADDFLLSFAGSKAEASTIFNGISTFVKSDLKLDIAPDKSRIVQAIDRKIKFLGFYVTAGPSKDNPNKMFQKGNFLEHRKRVLRRLKANGELNQRKFLKKAKKDLIRKAAWLYGKMSSKEKKVLNEEDLNSLAKVLAMEGPLDERQRFDSTMDTILSKSDNKELLPSNIFDAHDSLVKTIDSETSVTVNELHLAKSTGKTLDGEKISIRRLSLPLQLYAPLHEIRNKLKKRGMVSVKGKPVAFWALQGESPRYICQHYASIARGYLEYYRPASNLHRLKSIVNYHIRWSLLNTLAAKHRCSLKQVIDKYGVNLEKNVDTEGTFPSKAEVAGGWKRGFSPNEVSQPYELLNRIWLKRTSMVDEKECIVEGCGLRPEMHHVRQIKARTDGKGNLSVVNKKGIRKDGALAYMIAKNRKQIPLCPKHHKMVHKDLLNYRDKKIYSDIE